MIFIIPYHKGRSKYLDLQIYGWKNIGLSFAPNYGHNSEKSGNKLGWYFHHPNYTVSVMETK